jgi:hypothetical protein
MGELAFLNSSSIDGIAGLSMSGKQSRLNKNKIQGT